MEKIDLANVKSGDLERELDKRFQERQIVEEKKEKEKQFEAWMNRPPCAVVGKAYGSPHCSLARDYKLATVIIEGNMSWHYPVSLLVASSVETYLHNAWTQEDREELSNALDKLVNSLVMRKCNDVAVVTTLICLSESAGWRPLNERGKKILADWHKEALKRLLQFTLEELIAGKEKLERNHETCHGQIKLITEAITKKKGK